MKPSPKIAVQHHGRVVAEEQQPVEHVQLAVVLRLADEGQERLEVPVAHVDRCRSS